MTLSAPFWRIILRKNRIYIGGGSAPAPPEPSARLFSDFPRRLGKSGKILATARDFASRGSGVTPPVLHAKVMQKWKTNLFVKTQNRENSNIVRYIAQACEFFAHFTPKVQHSCCTFGVLLLYFWGTPI